MNSTSDMAVGNEQQPPESVSCVRPSQAAGSMPGDSISPTMRAAIEHMRERGDMVRFPGGFWAHAAWAHDGRWFSTPTVQALVGRGLADYCAWKDGRSGRFPIRACLSARALANLDGVK